jgi:hypothetical protein
MLLCKKRHSERGEAEPRNLFLIDSSTPSRQVGTPVGMTSLFSTKQIDVSDEKDLNAAQDKRNFLKNPRRSGYPGIPGDALRV